MAEKTPLTLYDVIVGIETDHGAPQNVGNYASIGFNNEITVCALGNAALDIVKRTGRTKNTSTITQIGMRLNTILKSLARQNGPRVILMNDSHYLTFGQIGERIRSWAIDHDFPLDKPIAYLEDI